MNTQERFMEKVTKTDSCWSWDAAKTVKGYGRFSVGNVNKLAHRVSYNLFKGSDDGLCVLHECDNPSCVNPDHLFLGTRADNIADMIAKGRKVNFNGERNPNRKLNEDDVLRIRTLVETGLSQYEIARLMGISQVTVSSISLRKSWRML